jgi:hypothetical protein
LAASVSCSAINLLVPYTLQGSAALSELRVTIFWTPASAAASITLIVPSMFVHYNLDSSHRYPKPFSVPDIAQKKPEPRIIVEHGPHLHLVLLSAREYADAMVFAVF